MIVITTFNGYDVLPNLLRGIESSNTKEKIAIVNGASTAPVFVGYLDGLRDKYLVIDQYDFPKGGFEVGALLTCYRDHPDERYLLIQDSVEINRPDWDQMFWDKLVDDNTVVPFATFHPTLLCQGPAHLKILDDHFGGAINNPEGGFFGNMFATTHKALEKLETLGYLSYVPDSKLGSEAMERGWAIAFHRAGMKIDPVLPGGFNNGKYLTNEGPLRKIFKGRGW